MSHTQEQRVSIEITEAEFAGKLKEILHFNGVTDTVSEVIVSDTGPQGVGFTCFTKLVTIKFDSLLVNPLHLFVKLRKEQFSHEEMLGEMQAFETEASFLVDYMRAATEMCKQKGRQELIDFYPKCYYGDAKMIVLENLTMKESGFEILDNEARHDLDTAKIAVETLAKHHAIAHAMIQENGGVSRFFEIFPHLNHECYDYDKPNTVSTMESLFENDLNSHTRILRRSKVRGAENTAMKLESYLGKPMGIIIETLKKQDKDNLFVLCHGDYRNNNMLFLRDKTNQKILHQKIIDLQLTRYNSPAIDLSYYFFTSVSPSVRRCNLHDLLKVYTDTFNKVIQDLGQAPHLAFEQIFSSYKEKMDFGFWMGLTVAVGPGMAEIMDKGNISEVDIKDSSAVPFDKLVDKWIDENIEKAEQIAEELVNMFKEYETLTLN